MLRIIEGCLRCLLVRVPGLESLYAPRERATTPVIWLEGNGKAGLPDKGDVEQYMKDSKRVSIVSGDGGALSTSERSIEPSTLWHDRSSRSHQIRTVETLSSTSGVLHCAPLLQGNSSKRIAKIVSC